MTATRRGPVLAEILSFEGCPHRAAADLLVRNAAAELGLEIDLRFVDVPDPDAAERLRFLGSPTIRVEGRDVEPGADERTTYVLACRVYEADVGVAGVPPASWVRNALVNAGRVDG